MESITVFDEHTREYENWFKRYPYVFKSEVAAIKTLIPKAKTAKGIEVAMASGRFAKALGIRQGIEPSARMRVLAARKNLFVLNAVAEQLPYKSLQFDFVLMNFCISYFQNLSPAFREAFRVLKKGGCLIVSFIDKNSRIGKYYRRRRTKSLFYRHATFYSVNRVRNELMQAGFKDLHFSQTLFHDLAGTKTTEQPLTGYGKGSFVIIKGIK